LVKDISLKPQALLAAGQATAPANAAPNPQSPPQP
jgi:hypothetical protein